MCVCCDCNWSGQPEEYPSQQPDPVLLFLRNVCLAVAITLIVLFAFFALLTIAFTGAL